MYNAQCINKSVTIYNRNGNTKLSKSKEIYVMKTSMMMTTIIIIIERLIINM